MSTAGFRTIHHVVGDEEHALKLQPTNLAIATKGRKGIRANQFGAPSEDSTQFVFLGAQGFFTNEEAVGIRDCHATIVLSTQGIIGIVLQRGQSQQSTRSIRSDTGGTGT